MSPATAAPEKQQSPELNLQSLLPLAAFIP